MTQAQLAEACGISISAVKAYENGRRRPSMKAIAALYRALGLDALEIAALYMGAE
jgi:transcriptional regulator with XRE-family HTH domain